MIKYKLTNQAMQTHGGFQWVLGKKEVIANPGAEMCSNQVFHYYASPEQAVLFNCMHADISNPRLFAADIDKEVSFDGLKGGCHEMTLVKELPMPVISLDERVEFAIRVALTAYHEDTFSQWAAKWLSGEDRSIVSARAASRAAALWTAEAAALWTARAAAESTARAAKATARAAEAAARAASWAASWAAAWAAEAAGENTLDFQPIIEEVLHK